jgi:hypothetical protein
MQGPREATSRESRPRRLGPRLTIPSFSTLLGVAVQTWLDSRPYAAPQSGHYSTFPRRTPSADRRVSRVSCAVDELTQILRHQLLAQPIHAWRHFQDSSRYVLIEVPRRVIRPADNDTARKMKGLVTDQYHTNSFSSRCEQPAQGHGYEATNLRHPLACEIDIVAEQPSHEYSF